MSEALNNSSNAASNMDVLLQAVSMAAPSPRNAKSADTIMSRSAVEKPSISAPPLLPTAGSSLWRTTSHFMAPPPLVTPPTTVELLEGHSTTGNNLPILTHHHHRAPSAIKSSHHYDGLFTTASLPAPKMRTNHHHPSMFVTTNSSSLPIKKRFANREGDWTSLPPPNGTLCDGSTRIPQTTTAPPKPHNTTTTTATKSSSSSSTKKEKKKYRKPSCSHPSCPNRVMNRGVCARHGARVRICSIPECSKYAQKGGVCIRHGAKKEYKRCCVAGCNSRATSAAGGGGTLNGRSVCSRHASSTFCVEIPIEARQDVSAGGRRIAQEEQRETF